VWQHENATTFLGTISSATAASPSAYGTYSSAAAAAPSAYGTYSSAAAAAPSAYGTYSSAAAASPTAYLETISMQNSSSGPINPQSVNAQDFGQEGKSSRAAAASTSSYHHVNAGQISKETAIAMVSRDIIVRNWRNGRVRGKARLDTGADNNFIRLEVVTDLGLQNNIAKSKMKLSVALADNTLIELSGTIILTWKLAGVDVWIESAFLIAKFLSYDMVIGVHEGIKRGLVTIQLPKAQISQLNMMSTKSKSKYDEHCSVNLNHRLTLSRDQGGDS
jgi:hypothetical protein